MTMSVSDTHNTRTHFTYHRDRNARHGGVYMLLDRGGAGAPYERLTDRH